MSDPQDEVLKELRWLSEHAHFEQRPATLREFLGADYLNIDSMVRDSIKNVLADIMGEEVNPTNPTKFPLAIFTGAIGIGKTTLSSIVLPYLVHWCLCLKDPQGYFNLLPGSRIAFMQMSTSEAQAREVVFGDIKARVAHSPWFKTYPPDPKFKTQLRFPKDIWILPGDSTETSFEGYNILGGILDEADSHKATKNKDYAEVGYDTIHARITSRFKDKGCLIVIGQMKKSTGFAAKKFREFRKRDDAYAARLTIWESLGWDHPDYQNTDGQVEWFLYDIHRKQIIPSSLAATAGEAEGMIRIPNLYLRDFENNPEKALRDLAGLPPTVNDPFISLVDRVEECRDRWVQTVFPESPMDSHGRLQPWFRAKDSLRRVCHIDLAYSPDGDACGFAMGHVAGLADVEGELKPHIVIDLLARWQAPAGRELFIGDVRRFIYSLRDELGFNIKMVTLDGFQSTDSMQQLRKKRFQTDLVSVDRNLLPYFDLRDAIYDRRLEFPPYKVRVNPSDTTLVEIAIQELIHLVDLGDKVDHPDDGSKDVSDAIAGVVTTLMGDRSYHRGRHNFGAAARNNRVHNQDSGPIHPAYLGDQGLQAPLPPTNVTSSGVRSR